MPARERLTGVLIEAGVGSVDHLDIADGAVRPDDRAERHRSRHIFAHELHGISRIHHVIGDRREQITFLVIDVEFGESHNPASSG